MSTGLDSHPRPPSSESTAWDSRACATTQAIQLNFSRSDYSQSALARDGIIQNHPWNTAGFTSSLLQRQYIYQ
eukprot:2221317-Rhodomonas_salina.1